MKTENNTKYYIIYDNNEGEKETLTKGQFLESLLFVITCMDLKEPITKEDIYFNMFEASGELHDGTIQEWLFELKNGSTILYRKINI